MKTQYKILICILFIIPIIITSMPFKNNSKSKEKMIEHLKNKYNLDFEIKDFYQIKLGYYGGMSHSYYKDTYQYEFIIKPKNYDFTFRSSSISIDEKFLDNCFFDNYEFIKRIIDKNLLQVNQLGYTKFKNNGFKKSYLYNKLPELEPFPFEFSKTHPYYQSGFDFISKTSEVHYFKDKDTKLMSDTEFIQYFNLITNSNQ